MVGPLFRGGDDNTWLSRQAKPVIEQMRKELEPLQKQAQETVKIVKESVLRQEKKLDDIHKVLAEILAELKKMNKE